MHHQDILRKLFNSTFHHAVVDMSFLPQSGSYRKYYRMTSKDVTVIGVFNEDVKENEAFIGFAESFFKSNLPVPKIIAVDKSTTCYLQDDLGDETLFSYLQKDRNGNEFGPNTLELYKKVVRWLPAFQVIGGKSVNYDMCYPRPAFDRQSMMWDLNYFKYYFLKLAKIPFDEQLLEDDYHTLCDFLLEADDHYFLYRDFQSRNIMIVNDEPHFIDFQGGRRGALQYDLASLLYDSKANITDNTRELLLNEYLEALGKYVDYNRAGFKGYYHCFVLIRMMQAMGAYGFRGFYEQKTHFLQSIPFALKQLRGLLESVELPVNLPHLNKVLNALLDSKELQKYNKEYIASHPLEVSIYSFSYRRGIPVHNAENGGGYVFDCRCIHNPGRYDQYKQLTGKHNPVIEFLQKDGEAASFLHQVKQLADQSIDRYLDRGFTNLQFSFGCTGGQHRSVYCAEELSKYLQDAYGNNVNITLIHREAPYHPKGCS